MAGKRKQEWTLLTFKDLEEWRERKGLSWKEAAGALGVTDGTWGNWKRKSSAPTKSTQARALEVINTPAPVAEPKSTDVAMQTTAQIVTTFLAANQKVSGDELVKMVRGVRQAVGA